MLCTQRILLFLSLVTALSLRFAVADYSKWSDLPDCAKNCFQSGVDNTVIQCGFSLACDCQNGTMASLVETCLLSSPPCDSNPTHDDVADYGNKIFCNASNPDSATYELVDGTYSMTLALYTQTGSQSSSVSIQMTSTITPSPAPSSTQSMPTNNTNDNNNTGTETASGISTSASSSTSPATSAPTSGPTFSLSKSVVTSYSTQVVTLDTSSSSTAPATVTIIASPTTSAAWSVFGKGLRSTRGVWRILVFNMVVLTLLAGLQQAGS